MDDYWMDWEPSFDDWWQGFVADTIAKIEDYLRKHAEFDAYYERRQHHAEHHEPHS